MSNFYSSEEKLVDQNNRLFMPHMQAMTSDNLVIADGTQLHFRYSLPANPKALIIIMQGRSESVIKYAELCYELHQSQYAVLIYDHRGQGLSTRLEHNRQIGFVDRFESYVDDAKAIILQLAPKLFPKRLPVHLLAHSMGAAIAISALISDTQPYVKSAALTAPMFGIQAPIPKFLALSLARLGLLREKLSRVESDYFYGQGNYIPKAFEGNLLTSSSLRYQLFLDSYQTDPRLQLGGVSNRWLIEVIKMMDFIQTKASEVTTPVKILVASADKVVDNAATFDVADRLVRADLTTVEGGEHEILFEQDKFRRPALDAILAFFDSKSTG